MISFREQVILIIYFLIFGMFLSAMFDILHYFLRKFKFKLVLSYIVESIFWIGMVVISCLYMLKVSNGYLTIYTFGFFFLGVVIYTYLMRDHFKKSLDSFVVFIENTFKKFRKTIILVVYPKEVLTFIKNVAKRSLKIKNLFIKLYKRLFKKKKNVGGYDEENKEIDNSIGSKPISTNSEWL